MRLPNVRPLLLPLVIVFLTIWSGCDTLDPGAEGVQADHDQEFRFETTADQLADGVEITAESGFDVGATVAGLGFSKGDIVSAEVTSAELSRVTPLDRSLNEILASATVRLSSAGSTTTVAQASSISSGTTTQMQASGGNIGSHARAASSSVVLQAEPVDELQPGNYVFRVRMRVRLTLEGV